MSLGSLIGEKLTSFNPPFNNLRGILDEKFCDVTVTVSHAGSSIKCYKLHRNILSGCSSVLHQSLEYQQTLDITYMSPDEFELLIVYMYTGDVCFHSVSELCFGLYAANLFKFDVLVDKCTERLLTTLVENCENALKIIKLDERFQSRANHFFLFAMVDEKIQKNYRKILTSDIIKDLERETMRQLLQMDSFCDIPEVEVFNSLLKWTTARCDESEHHKQIQDVANDLIYCIRYNLMPEILLSDIFAESKLLPPELMVQVLQRKTDHSLDSSLCTRSRQKWDFVSTCTNVEHLVHELSQWTTSSTIIWNGMKGESKWFSLSMIATTNIRWQVQFNRCSNDDFEIKVHCPPLDKQLRAVSFRLFATVEEHPDVWTEATGVLNSSQISRFYFSKKMNELQGVGLIKVRVQLQWTELDQLPPMFNMWMEDAASIRCRWQLNGWNSVTPTSNYWSVCSEAFGINGALWRIFIDSKSRECDSDRNVDVRVYLQHVPAYVNYSRFAIKCSLSLWDQLFDEKKMEMKERSFCLWPVIKRVSFESRQTLNMIVTIRIKAEN